MPTLFFKYAVDFDGDGRRDIWTSVPDVLASIANNLRGEGWNPARGWGIEVKVPASVSCTLEGPEQGKPIEEWTKLGVTRVDGGGLPGAGKNRKSFLLMPAGRFGPAFLVSENFYVLKEYNYSDLYALYIGSLADRIGGGAGFSAPWGDIGVFKRIDVKRMQEELVAEGYDVGKVDGLVGFKTRIAVGSMAGEEGQAGDMLSRTRRWSRAFTSASALAWLQAGERRLNQPLYEFWRQLVSGQHRHDPQDDRRGQHRMRRVDIEIGAQLAVGNASPQDLAQYFAPRLDHLCPVAPHEIRIALPFLCQRRIDLRVEKLRHRVAF